jgi:hypothetical protein
VDKCIKDAIVELSALSGSFDFEVTWDRKFNVYYPGIGRRRDDIPISIPGGVKELTATNDGTLFANHVIGQGSGSGSAKLRSVSDDTPSQQVFGRWSKTIPRNGILSQTQLQASSDAYLAAVSSPLTIPEVVIDGTVGPDITQVGIGDQLRFMVDSHTSGFEDLDGNYYRIESLSWQVDADNVEDLRIVLAA